MQRYQKYQLCKRLKVVEGKGGTFDEDDWKRDTEFSWHQEETVMYLMRAKLPPGEGALVIKARELIVAENEKAEKVAEKVKVDYNNGRFYVTR